MRLWAQKFDRGAFLRAAAGKKTGTKTGFGVIKYSADVRIVVTSPCNLDKLYLNIV